MLGMPGVSNAVIDQTHDVSNYVTCVKIQDTFCIVGLVYTMRVPSILVLFLLFASIPCKAPVTTCRKILDKVQSTKLTEEEEKTSRVVDGLWEQALSQEMRESIKQFASVPPKLTQRKYFANFQGKRSPFLEFKIVTGRSLWVEFNLSTTPDALIIEDLIIQNHNAQHPENPLSNNQDQKSFSFKSIRRLKLTLEEVARRLEKTTLVTGGGVDWVTTNLYLRLGFQFKDPKMDELNQYIRRVYAAIRKSPLDEFSSYKNIGDFNHALSAEKAKNSGVSMDYSIADIDAHQPQVTLTLESGGGAAIVDGKLVIFDPNSDFGQVRWQRLLNLKMTTLIQEID